MEFSKLSIMNKSTCVTQTMQWIIPQSRLNQHCPFLEKEYPYYSTEFSVLHPSTSVEVKWRLLLERINKNVSVNLLNMNEKDHFDSTAEVKSVEVRWSARLMSGQEDGPMGMLSEYMFHQRENMRFSSLQFYKNSENEGRVICDLASFDSFVKDGNFIVEVKIEIERFLHEENKISFFDPYTVESV